MVVKKQLITDNYALHCGDCVEVLADYPDESIGFSVFSPPFSDLYSYTDEQEDMSNVRDYKEFFKHFRFLVNELLRLMLPGRVVAVHCMDIPTYKRDGEGIGIRDFPGDIVRCFQKVGFIFHSRHCIWKDPLIAATRTKAIGLAHKSVVKDSSICRTGIPDYIVSFRKPGENLKPIENLNGFTEYIGSRSVPKDFDKYIGCEIPKKNRRSQWIWQQYASPVWFDIDQTKVLPFRNAKGKDDTKHICPLQLQTIERCMVLWSREGDNVLSPFMGVGSEVYVAVKNGRRGIGVELKKSYYRQAVLNVKQAEKKRSAGFDL
ncbi:hypothetical protein LCGC14_0248470 [marine sediment metagenome]|uniref:DNA methylase N-4/N-6 domain-containing protein n=1 Tax=marine sediment metagenome TaxID=412755 RepID=A0A0F9U501_9ZZZZ